MTRRPRVPRRAGRVCHRAPDLAAGFLDVRPPHGDRHGRDRGLQPGVPAVSRQTRRPRCCLTLCCTWAYFHFWFAVTAEQRRWQFLHAMLFYVAMGFAMLAKGPAPIAVTAIPLAVWWYTQRPLKALADEGLGAWRQVLLLFLRDLWPRTIQVFTKLWLLPGLIVFASHLRSLDAGGGSKAPPRVEPLELAVLATGPGTLRGHPGARHPLLPRRSSRDLSCPGCS